MLRWTLSFIGLLLFLGCTAPLPKDGGPHILVLGDSMMSSNRLVGGSVANEIARGLNRKVTDRSLPGARYFFPLPITGSLGLRLPEQFGPGAWDIVVLNGGGNDLLFGCGCGACTRVLNRLISADGRAGAIPKFVKSMRMTGAQVIYVGYLRNPGVQTPVKACGPAGNELDRRLALLDMLDDGMTFLPMSDIVPDGDRSFHQIDLIHPSSKGSAAIAARITAQLRAILPPSGTPAP